MAGLYGLKILLLWAGLMELVISTGANDTLTSTPTSTSKPPSTSPTNSSSETGANDTLTSTPTSTSKPPSTSPTKSSSETGQNPTTPQKCSYNVKPIQYGVQVNITNLNEDLIINYKEDNDGEGQNQTVRHSKNSTIYNVTSLKPCTNYTIQILEPSCDEIHNVTTLKMVESEITAMTTEMIGHICYSSDWNISKAMKSSRNTKYTPQNNLCYELKPENFCADVTSTFGDMCDNNFNITTNITMESFGNNITLTHPTSLPGNVTWTNEPVNCNLTLIYTCENQSKVSELEPFTDYKCTSKVKYHNNTMIPGILQKTNVRIDCDLNITDIKSEVDSNTSIRLSWNIHDNKCGNAILQNIAYNCCCKSKSNETCSPCKSSPCYIRGLTPFTDYKCSVQPNKYKEMAIKKMTYIGGTIKTSPGEPDKVTFQLTLTKNNEITIKCHNYTDTAWKGNRGTFTARITSPHQKSKTEKNCEFVFNDLSYLTTYKVEVFAWNNKLQSVVEEKEFTTRYNDKALTGFLVFFIILTSLALLLVLYKICILQRKKSINMEQIQMVESNDEKNLLNIEPIGSEVLLDAYKKKIADEGRLFLQEFQSIPRIFSCKPVREAKKSCNQPKNRYVDILPYDSNRVQLTSGNGEVGCDYINASFIDGFKESKKYIAAQGPKEETVGDFWRMVWEQKSSIIVMVTRCEEGNRIKCAQYWPSPERETEIYEEFIVKLNGENICPDYTIRHLSLANKRERCSERAVTHIQFTSWPDHGVPGEPHLLLKLRRRVNSFKNLFSGPIVIHCSAGVGRTGTYMGIDAMMEGLESEGRVDIYGYVVGLRRQRCLMVQVEAQYILIHQALIEHNQFGETEIPLAELHSTLSTLKQKEPGNEPTLLQVEFQRLPWYKNWRTYNSGVNEDNKKKNRSSSVIPYDYNRVLVKLEDECSRDQDDDVEDDEDESSDEEEESTKYINATHIDGYWCQRNLIAAQGPLADTIEDFWQMIFQKRVKTIVMLTECREGDQEFCSAYWGDEKRTFGDIEVEVTATETLPAYITRSIQIHHAKRKDTRQMKQYHFLKWAGRELPEKPHDFMDMIKNIKQTCGYGNGKPERILPVVVHCNDGSSRSGIFCALWNILDSAETEKLVDVFQVAKALRKERQGMINSLEQYHFLYEAVEGAFPVQNGEVKQPAPTTPSPTPPPPTAPVADSVQVVNENMSEQPVSTTTTPQQQALVIEEAEESTPLVAEASKETAADAEVTQSDLKEPGSPTEKTPLEESSSPVVTMDV
ncbi:hypothetical protein DPEC_G00337800 [Dallia pectoralis]|uniref:Uncharacterized protein n=1 Tax=Dallia pectoralis TaxID=75939 RepID=A0ACC2F4B7_DALPE|nr:hypothetical protein DPEC_G00337800 [Dallia pectoralis]